MHFAKDEVVRLVYTDLNSGLMELPVI